MLPLSGDPPPGTIDWHLASFVGHHDQYVIGLWTSSRLRRVSRRSPSEEGVCSISLVLTTVGALVLRRVQADGGPRGCSTFSDAGHPVVVRHTSCTRTNKLEVGTNFEFWGAVGWCRQGGEAQARDAMQCASREEDAKMSIRKVRVALKSHGVSVRQAGLPMLVCKRQPPGECTPDQSTL